jgi:FAD synthase
MPDGRQLAVVAGVRGLRRDVGRLLVAVGVFDGLHRGHASLLRALVREAARREARPAVLTFDAHPDEIVRGAAPPLLLDPEERLVRLAAAGVEVVVVEHFDAALRETPYDVFVESITSRVDLAGFVMTADAAFGHNREGTVVALGRLGASTRPGFEVVVVPPYLVDGRPVRSTEIRAHVAAGRLADARQLLGRRHSVTGSPEADDCIAFRVPVALPPPGAYRIRFGPPASLDLGVPAPRRTVVARVDPSGRVELPARAAAGARVRLAFGYGTA